MRPVSSSCVEQVLCIAACEVLPLTCASQSATAIAPLHGPAVESGTQLICSSSDGKIDPLVKHAYKIEH